MDPRKLIATAKKAKRSREWSGDDIPPRWSVFPKTRKTPPGWLWKAATLEGEGGEELMVLAQANPARDNWKTWLVVVSTKSVVLRLEQHGAAGEGVHIHSDCANSDVIHGPESIDGAEERLDSKHMKVWSKESFWTYTCKVFRIETGSPQGELL